MMLLKRSRWSGSYVAMTIYFIGILFSVIVIWSNTLHTPSSLKWNSWVFYEWIINYEGGFVRRGLIGSVINAFYYGEELSAVNTLVFFVALLFILLATMCVASNVKNARSALLFVFCPVGFYWMAIGNEYYYRKEIFFFIAILCACLIFQRWQIYRNHYLVLILTGFIFATSILLPLVHEAFLFYGWLPFSLMLLQIHQENGTSGKRVVIAYTVVSLVIFAILSYYSGDANTSKAIWLSLSDSAKALTVTSGPAGGISAIGWSLTRGLSLSVIALQTGLASYYIFSIILIYLFVGYIVSENRSLDLKQIYLSKQLLLPFGVVVVSFLPLFVIGWDWGRWVMCIWYVSLFIFLLNLDKQIVEFFPNTVGLLRKMFVFVVFPILLSLGLITRVPECCFSGSGTSFFSNPVLSNFNPVLSNLKEFLKQFVGLY